MEDANRAEDFVPVGLAALGVKADEVELAVIGAAHAMFWPAILEVLAFDTGDLAPETDLDLSQPPAPA